MSGPGVPKEIGGLAERLGDLSPAKRRLLLRRLGAPPAAPAAAPAILASEPATAPASFAQRRLWLAQRLDPGSAAYNLPFAFRLAGPLDAALLARALTEIARRHEPLRTTFAEAGGEPRQVIAPPAPVRLPRIDLFALPPERRRPVALGLAAEDAARPFDLAHGPLWRPLLLHLSPAEHVVSLTMHHIVTDGWSNGLLLREVAALYPAFAAGLPSPLPALPARYADLAARQRRWLGGPEAAALLAWWKERLAGAPALGLPARRPPAARRGDRGGLLAFAWTASSVAPLRELARARGATLYMGLLAVFQLLLHRHTGQDDFAVGSPVAGREAWQARDLIGFFVNTVALRGRVEGEEGFSALLERTRTVCLEAWARQELPFDQLIQEMRPERTPGRTPLFQVVLSLEERPPATGLPGFDIEPLQLSTGASKFDLTLMLSERGGRIDGFAEHAADVFDPPALRRFLGHFENLLLAAAAHPGCPVQELPLLSEAERHQLARETAVREEVDGEADLYTLFAAQAERRPDAVALGGTGVSMTYGELARRAADLALRLRALGAGPEVPVALWCERTPGLVTAVLGVLAAGGIYVPMDPAWPVERLALVLADSGARLLVWGGGGPPPSLPAGVRVVEMEKRPSPLAPLPGRERGTLRGELAFVDPDNAAYLIYTSGSTGRPKGVAVTHRNVARLLAATAPLFQFGPDDVWTLFHSYAFDFSVWEMWGALAFGGRLVVVPWEISRSPHDFNRLLLTENVTILNQTPSAYKALLQEQTGADGGRGALSPEGRNGGSPRPERSEPPPTIDFEPLPARAPHARRGAPTLRTVIFGGEDCKDIKNEKGEPRLVNMYGITETTVHVTFHLLAPEDADGTGSAIGRPLPDLSAHVLGPALEPVPLGVPGELFVGGAGLARGYWGRPDLTAQRFVPDTFAAEPGARLYRSGDRVRVRPAGDLEYLGRVDRQVKVRGFRIEPGEIEAVLARHPGVAEAAVVPRDDLPGGRGLAAFWVVGTEAVPGAAELRAFLKEQLPEPLVPAVFLPLPRLPLTPNGKLDRRALAAWPLAGEGAAGEEFTPPQTPVEELLAGLWSELLGRERVGRDDDFLALGGHSLLATQLVSRVRETLGVEVPLRAVFEAPTPAGLAVVVESTRVAAGSAEEEPLVPEPRQGDLPLSFAQQRLWFLDRLVPGNPFYVMAFGLRLTGPLAVAALAAALAEVVRRHESLRTTFLTVEGEPRQRVEEGAVLGLPGIDLSRLAPALRESGLADLGREAARRPFNLARGPLLRAFLVRLGPDDHVLLLHLHHIVADGWSLGVLRRELAALYEAAVDGRPHPLPPLPVQYPDFALWQRRRLSGESLKRLLAYWRRQLDGAPRVLDLPFDRPRPGVESFRGATASFRVPADLVRRLHRLGRELGVTLSMTALAAFDLLLARYTGRHDVVVGSAVAGRNRREIEDLIGFFVNVLVLRTRLTGAATFAALAARVRETSLDAYAHQDLPFEKLVEELQLPRDLSHHPLCQVMVGFQNFPRPEGKVRGLTFTPLVGATTDTGTAKADLTLFLAEDGEGLAGALEYNADLFEPATILRLAGHLTSLLGAVAGEPGGPLRGISLLAPGERHQLVWEWSAALAAGSPEVELLPARILARARERPDATALVGPGGTLSYEFLLRRAGRLAWRLRREGAGPEVRVGICLARPDARVQAVLGVLFAGAAWVVLDADHPPARLAFLVGDSGVGLVVTEPSLLPRLGGGPGAPSAEEAQSRSSGVARFARGGECLRFALPARAPQDLGPLVRVLFTEEDGRAEEGEEGVMDAEVLPGHLGYGIYTSGSTGLPKGVGVSHGSLARMAEGLIRAYGVGPDDRVLQMMSPGFDVFVSEVALALGSGATLHLAEREERLPGPPLAGLLREREITVLNLVPSLLAALETSDLPALETLILGGEACPPDLAWRWASGRRLHVAYGPTETTVTCSGGRVEPGGRPDLGRPLAGARIHLLDRDLELVPVGLPGEIAVAGPGLARGYLGRSDVTASSFVPDPFGEPGSRLYRTGDLARRLPDGRLEFLGRLDEQVKVRGFRIEPGEVEARLAGHPEIEVAVVAPQGDRLVAWVVPRRAAAGGEAGEQEEAWRGLYDEVYDGAAEEGDDPDADLVGWNSSFTGAPLPASEMREWAEATAGEILALGPARVLEIGCGTGLILRKVAPHCTAYVGTDFSPAALTRLARRVGELPQVRLERRAARDFAGLPERGFDAVVLNSVVQYFPGVDYLAEVVEKAVAATADGGAVFLGDVRSLALAEALYLALELHGADLALPLPALRNRAAARRLEEPELLIHPELFYALPRTLPRVCAVEVRPKRGRADNELTRYRYQVVLRVGEGRPAAGEPGEWLDWERDVASLAGLGRRLRAERPEMLAVEGIPDARLARDVAALSRLAAATPRATAGQLTMDLQRLGPAGVHPDDLRDLAREHGYEAVLGMARRPEDGRFEAVLCRGHAGGRPVLSSMAAMPGEGRPLANDPLLGRLARRLGSDLREWARETLPEPLVPSAVVVLDELPRTPGGKVDRRALAVPELAAVPAGDAGSPRTPAEGVVAEVFAALLGRQRPGPETDFFAAGGHSLLATQVVSRLRDRLGVEVSLRDFFATPTVAGLARLVESALADRPAALAPPLRPARRDGPSPLSFAQERLWFLDQLDAGRSPWNVGTAVRFTGRLDLAALAAALNRVVRRHEALRTTFGVEGGRPVQRIAPELRLDLPRVDLASLPGERREAELVRALGEEVARPFDLAAGPLLRAVAFLLGPEDHAVALTLHHIVSDGWSMGVLIRELGALYARPGERLAELPVQYADFALWQRGWLDGEVLERQLAWWREHLAGAPPLLDLPLDRPRPPYHAFRGRRRRGGLPPTTVAALETLARRAGATLFMTLLAAWKALLRRATGEVDLVVGTPVANRNRAEIEGLIGFFVNTLVMRTDLAGDPSFSTLLARVREAALGAYAHQDLPFEKLVGELAPERNPRHPPIFQVLFAFEEEPPLPPALPGLALTPLGADSRTVKFDLTLLARRSPDGGGVELVLGYNSDLFHPTTAARLLGHLETLTAGLAADPGRPLSEQPLLSAAEHHRVVLEANDTAAWTEPVPLHGLLARQAERVPDRIALSTAGAAVSYGELARRARCLARRLRGEGVGPEVRVGLLLDRSPGLVTALAAVLEAGGAWVPLDPGLPRERLAFMLADSGAALVVGEERLVAALPEGCRFLPLSAAEEQTGLADAGEAREGDISPDRLAYVIYTSGSTGVPKGVAVSHRGIASLAAAQVEDFGHLVPGDRILQFSSPAFDAFVSELAITWRAGAELHLPTREEALPGGSLAALLAERAITNVTLPPTALAVTPLQRFPALRSLVVAGEPCPPELAETWSLGRLFVNAYGPTEGTVCATAGPYERGSLHLDLGRAITDAGVLLLDPLGTGPVALGVAGEVCLAGPGLARGYLGRPDLTAGRFVPHPASDKPGARLYRTGDLARRLPDGRLDYLGRRDEQVKVRGFRVEPGEVRAALLTHPAVREAEVAAPAGTTGERRLVAWVAADPQASPGAAELRRFLADRLPDWLLPSRFVFLETLPRTPGGKVDRRALPPPDEGTDRTVAGRREPADALEAFLLSAWQEVLGMGDIGMEENFFDLGGTSLQAAILTNLLQERLGDYVYAVALFDAPTIAELARYLALHYPEAVARVTGGPAAADGGEVGDGPRVNDAMVAEIRRLIGERPRRPAGAGPRNPRAVFVLSPPRSGSTLLRVLLAGNRRLFAPPELELLGFDTLGERAALLSGRFALWQEGLVRAVMEARGLAREEAAALLAGLEAEDLPVGDLYRRLQGWTAGRTLVDKTPSYALDPGVLARAEELFEEPLYLHLLRHPYGMIASFEEAKLEQVFFRPRHDFPRRRLAELLWLVSHENILAFLSGVPPERQLAVRFEELVRHPRPQIERLSAFLGVPFEEGMLEPYAHGERKMTDGVHALSRMLGDVKFHTHKSVDPAVAERWQGIYREDFLGEETAGLARRLGYTERARRRFSPLVQLRPGEAAAPLFLVHPMGGGVLCYRELAARLGDGQPVYGLQARGMGEGEEPDESIEAMAATYLEEVRRVQPAGPYRLGGWSLGGTVAFEMARRLAEEGETVDLLALLDAVAPGTLAEVSDQRALQGFTWEIEAQAGQGLGVKEEDLHGLDGEEGVRLILERGKESGALPAGFGIDQALRLWRVVRIGLTSGQTYRPDPYAGSAALFVAAGALRPDTGPDLGWRRYVTGDLERIAIDASHATVLRGPALEQIAAGLRHRLGA